MRSTPDRPIQETTMNRQAIASVLSRFAVRLAALGSACGITALIVVVHAADLTTLGGHDVVMAGSPTTVASAK